LKVLKVYKAEYAKQPIPRCTTELHREKLNQGGKSGSNKCDKGIFTQSYREGLNPDQESTIFN
jgi:hypothetical protein